MLTIWQTLLFSFFFSFSSSSFFFFYILQVTESHSPPVTIFVCLHLSCLPHRCHSHSVQHRWKLLTQRREMTS